MNRRRFFKILAVPALAPLAGSAWFGWARSRNPYYEGPVSDHFDGLRFYNPGRSVADKSPVEAFRALVLAQRAKWPEHFPGAPGAPPPALVPGAGLRVTLVGHASVLLQTSGRNILIDPVFAERASPVSFSGPKRVNPPGIRFEDLPRIDTVLVTHNHYDHLDVETLARLRQRFDPQVVTPLGNDTIMRAHDSAIRVSAHDWGEDVDLGGGLRTTLVPTLHWSARGVADRRKALWASFVIEGPAGVIYHVGDTAFAPDLARMVRERFGAPRLAILPIGAYEPRWFMKDNHMDPDEAVETLLACGAQEAVAHHWGTFQLTAEAIDEPPRRLSEALQSRGLPAERFRVLRPGEAFEAGVA